MAEEAKVTPESEKIDSKVEIETKVEETKETVIDPRLEDNQPTVETVPLGTYLALKDDIKELKRELKETKESKKASVVLNGVKDLAEKYPDVNQEFIQDILSSATSQAQSEIEKKYTPILEKQEMEKKQEAFNRAFDSLFEKTLNDNPDLPRDIDKDSIKELALTPKYRNIPLQDILLRLYPVKNVGKSSSENESRSASDRVEDIVNFDKITNEQKKAIMADPVARKKYFDYLDTK